VTGSLSGNPNLVNETADAWTVGAVVRPRFLPNLTLAVDWVDIVVNGAVTALTGTNVMEACYDSTDYPNSLSASGTNFCDLFTRNTTPGQQFGQVTFLELQFDNAARRRFRGLISELQYRLDTPFLGATSSVTLGVNYLYNDRLDLQVGTSDLTTLDTSIGYSKHQFTANATYRNAGFSWQWQAQYIGPALIDPDAADDTYEFPGNGSSVLFNSSMSYNINDRFRVSFVVDNVFNSAPPFPRPAGGGSVTYFDQIRGRYFRFGAGVRF
jgi:outer membrane receptor protein involved in Fe transport